MADFTVVSPFESTDVVYERDMVDKQKMNGRESVPHDVRPEHHSVPVGIQNEMNYHLQCIVKEYKRRTAKNARYSLRAYASFLSLDPSALSRILAGKQELSVKSGLAIVKRLQMSNDEGRRFLLSVIDGRKRNEAARVGRFVEAPHLRPNPAVIPIEVFAKISNVAYFALLELTQTEDFKSDPDWIAMRLGLEAKEVEDMIETLLSVGLLKTEAGRLLSSHAQLTTVRERESSQSLRNLHEGVLSRASHSLKKDAAPLRAHYAMTMAIDPGKLELARQRIREFMENLSDELATSSRTEVFQLGVQLFPLSTPLLPDAGRQLWGRS